jgi:hypothetical protein
MEENLGETFIRLITAFVTLVTSVTVCVTQIISGDITTGTVYIMVTGKTVPVGKCTNFCRIL